MLDRKCTIEVKISRYDKSFITNEIIDGFYKSFFGLKISLKDMDIYVVILDILFHEFTEFCNEFRLFN